MNAQNVGGLKYRKKREGRKILCKNLETMQKNMIM